LTIQFSVNDSPNNGSDGKVLTVDELKKRLEYEASINVALQVSDIKGGKITVQGRGELQLGILMETMRREGSEFLVSPPKVVFKKDENGNLMEPVEELFIDCNMQHSGSIIQKLMLRKCDFIDMEEKDEKCRIHFHAPTRALMGYFSEFRNQTGGTGTINHYLLEYQPYKGPLEDEKNGALISHNNGTATAYALNGLEDKGTFFVGVNDRVYIGQVIGEHVKPLDLEINIVKEKKLANMRNSKDGWIEINCSW
jgi:GTP-binding protein